MIDTAYAPTGNANRSAMFDLPAAEKGTSAEWRVAQNPFLIAALVFATGGLYSLWWLARTWSQIKREDGDSGKAPIWHALTAFVPIYCFFRFHAHMRAIADLAPVPTGIALAPRAMTFAYVLIELVGSPKVGVAFSVWVTTLTLLSASALFGWAQHALNATWGTLPGGAVKGRVHPLHWVILAMATLGTIGGLLGGD